MILVDTSIWIDHWRFMDVRLASLLATGNVVLHPFVLGELMLGSLADRSRKRSLLLDLIPAPVATDDNVLDFVETQKLHGAGIGWVDCHLLVSTMMIPGVLLYTRDRRLDAIAQRLGIAL